MSLNPQYAVREPGFETPEPGHGFRPEDLLRLAGAGLLILIAGLALGLFTSHELQVRGTGYFVLALCLAVVLTGLAYYQFELVLGLFVSVIWINLGGTPDVAQGVSSGTGKSLYPVELGAMFFIALWLLRGLGRGRLAWTPSPMTKPLIAYLLFSVWTAVNGYLFWDPALTRFYAGMPGGGRTAPQVIVIEIAMRFMSVGMFWVVAGSLTDGRWLRRITLLYLLPGLAVGLGYFHLLPSLGATWPTLLEIPLACMLFAWLLEARDGARPGLRVLGWLALGVVIFQVFFMNITWISGWIALFCGLYWVALLKSPRLFMGLLCAGLLLVVLAQPFLKTRVVHKVQTSGDLDRFSMARASVRYALKFPLGIGPGNYRAYNMYYGSRQMWNTTGYTSAHGFYAQSLSEMGFIGLILTVWWVATGVVLTARSYRRAPPGFSRTVLLGLAGLWCGVSVASFLGDYLIPVYHNGGLLSMTTTIYAWIGLGLAVAHARLAGVLGEKAAPAEKTAVRPASAASFYPRRLSP